LSFYSCVFIVTILYLRAVVRAKTVSLSVRHIAYFTFTFLHTVQINDDENDESMQ